MEQLNGDSARACTSHRPKNTQDDISASKRQAEAEDQFEPIAKRIRRHRQKPAIEQAAATAEADLQPRCKKGHGVINDQRRHATPRRKKVRFDPVVEEVSDFIHFIMCAIEREREREGMGCGIEDT